VLRAIKAKDKDAATSAYQAAMPIVDSMVNKGIIHKNKANRHKSRLNKHIRAL
jgi:small subunit ribosomal protein S20